MKNIILLTVTALFLFGSRAFAQNDTSFWNNKMAEIAMANSSPGWVRLKEDIQFIPNNFFAENKQAFGLKQDDNMILVKTETDDLGFTHYRYQHTYKEIKVEGCEYILHTQNNQVISANGKLACNLNFDVTPSISENTALSVALSSINATKYGWDVKRNDTTYWSNYPQGELILARIKNNKDFSENNYKLAYKFIIMGIEPFYSSHVVYVDAKSSEVIKKQSLLKDYQCNCCNGTAQTLYNGQQTIVTRHRGVPLFNYLLKDNCRGDGIQTYLAGSNLTDGDNNWSAISERPATSAHWAAEMTYDFYNNTYGRNSFDGNGKMIEVYTDETFGFSFPGLNAQWDSQGQRLRFGNGHAGIANALVSLDVVGHEFTHAVTENEANFIYEGESGALDESFCDIFGIMVEHYAGTGDYEIGEEFIITTDPTWLDILRRSMSNPNNFNDPDTYEGNFWIDPNDIGNDFGGVHTNSGVQNFWFFLLSEGGNGTNDNGDAYAVQGIGRNNAASISYRNLTFYLTSSSDYADAKNGSIFSAMDLFGNCSNEVLQTVNAWNAVGVSSSTGFGFDLVVNCAALNFFHNGFPPFVQAQPYTARAINNLTTNCVITPNGQPVTFIAGNTITLTDGFRSGDNFHAFIDPCVASANKMANNNGNSNDNPHSTISKGLTIDDEGDAEIIENSIAKKFSVFPNPNKGNFTINIQGELSNNAKVEIYSLDGSLKYSSAIVSKQQNIIFTQTPGMYLIRIYNNEKKYTEKIILQ